MYISYVYQIQNQLQLFILSNRLGFRIHSQYRALTLSGFLPKFRHRTIKQFMLGQIIYYRTRKLIKIKGNSFIIKIENVQSSCFSIVLSLFSPSDSCSEVRFFSFRLLFDFIIWFCRILFAFVLYHLHCSLARQLFIFLFSFLTHLHNFYFKLFFCSFSLTPLTHLFFIFISVSSINPLFYFQLFIFI